MLFFPLSPIMAGMTYRTVEYQTAQQVSVDNQTQGIYYGASPTIWLPLEKVNPNKSAKALVSEALLSARAYAQVVR